MKEIKRKLKYIVIVLIVVLAAYFIIGPYYNGQTEQWCFNSGGNCVYGGVPSGLLFTSPNDDLFFNDVYNVMANQEQIDEYLVRDNSSRRLSEVFSGDYYSYVCSNTQEMPEIVEYFFSYGYWHDRRAVICGNIYFVVDFTSSRGPVYYGPFEIGVKPTIMAKVRGENFSQCLKELKENRFIPAEQEPVGAVRADEYDWNWTKNEAGLWEGYIGRYFTQYRHDSESKVAPIGTVQNDSDGWTWKKTSDIAWSGFKREKINKTSDEVDYFPNGNKKSIDEAQCYHAIDDIDVSDEYSLS